MCHGKRLCDVVGGVERVDDEKDIAEDERVEETTPPRRPHSSGQHQAAVLPAAEARRLHARHLATPLLLQLMELEGANRSPPAPGVFLLCREGLQPMLFLLLSGCRDSVGLGQSVYFVSETTKLLALVP